jgi:hypothetical protein
MIDTPAKVDRPLSITIISVIGFIGALISIPLMFTPVVQQLGPWYSPYLGFSIGVGFTCMIGLWMMKKWAAYTYTGFVVLNQFILLATGLWNILALLGPAVVIFFAMKNLSKMT